MTQAEARRRREQSRRDRLLAGAQLRSIPKRKEPKVPLKQLLPQALRSMQFAPRGHGFYDAYSNSVDSAMLSVSVGPCTVVEGFGRTTVIGWGPFGEPGAGVQAGGGAPDNSVLIMFNPGRGATRVLKVVRKNPDGTSLDNDDVHIPQFPSPGVNGENESIPIRGSIQITNVAESLTRGGTVRFLRYNAGVARPTTPAEYDDLADMVRSSARTQNVSGEVLTKSFQSNSYPADFSRSVEFSGEDFASGFQNPAYSTVMILIDSFFPSSNGFNNTYEVTCKVQRAYRFQPGTTLHTLAREVPVMPSEHHSRHVHRESRSIHARPTIMDSFKQMGSDMLAPMVGSLAGQAGKAIKTRFLPTLTELGPQLARLALL